LIPKSTILSSSLTTCAFANLNSLTTMLGGILLQERQAGTFVAKFRIAGIQPFPLTFSPG
jgi:hypothetical protein